MEMAGLAAPPRSPRSSWTCGIRFWLGFWLIGLLVCLYPIFVRHFEFKNFKKRDRPLRGLGVHEALNPLIMWLVALL